MIHWQAEIKATTHSCFTFHPYLSAVQFNQMSGDGEAEAGASGAVVFMGMHLDEFVEDFLVAVREIFLHLREAAQQQVTFALQTAIFFDQFFRGLRGADCGCFGSEFIFFRSDV